MPLNLDSSRPKTDEHHRVNGAHHRPETQSLSLRRPRLGKANAAQRPASHTMRFSLPGQLRTLHQHRNMPQERP
jgi:hypothetical protein